MAIRLDSTTESFTRTANLPTPTSWTVAGWFTRRGTGGSANIICGLFASGASAYQYIGDAGTNVVVASHSASANIIASPSVNTPYFFALTCSGTGSGNLIGYYGLRNATSLTSASLSGVSFTPATFSLSDSSFGAFCNGDIGPLYVWNAVLTADQLLAQSKVIRLLWTANINLNLSMMRLTASDNAIDFSGNGRNMTVNGSPTVADNPPISYGAGGHLISHATSSGISVLLDTASISTAGILLDVVPGAKSLSLDTALLNTTGRVLDVVPGTKSLLLDTAILNAGAVQSDIIPGAKSLPLDTAVLSAVGQAASIGIISDITLPLDTALLQSAPVAFDVVPGAKSLTLDTALLSAIGRQVNVGSISVITLDTALLISTGRALSVIEGGITTLLDTALLSVVGRALDVVPGAVSKSLNTAIILTQGQAAIIVEGSVQTILQTGMVTATPQTIDILLGGAIIPLDTASILASGKALNVIGAVESIIREWSLTHRSANWTIEERSQTWSLILRNNQWSLDDER